MTLALDLRSELRWLSSGFLLTLCSGFGQTYFIALFAGQLRGELSLTDGEFGSLYTLGTLASAITLVWAGRLADAVPIRWLGAGVFGGLALTSVAMSTVASPLMLVGVLTLLTHERHPTLGPSRTETSQNDVARRQWERSEVVRSRSTTACSRPCSRRPSS